jgi:hypothetical protein
MTEDSGAQRVVPDDRNEKLSREIVDQDKEALFRQHRTKDAADRYTVLNTVAVIASVVLASGAGLVSLLGDTDAGRYVAAGLAVAAAIVSGLTKAFDLPRKRNIKYAVYTLYGRWRDDLSSLARAMWGIFRTAMRTSGCKRC